LRLSADHGSLHKVWQQDLSGKDDEAGRYRWLQARSSSPNFMCDRLDDLKALIVDFLSQSGFDTLGCLRLKFRLKY